MYTNFLFHSITSLIQCHSNFLSWRWSLIKIPAHAIKENRGNYEMWRNLIYSWNKSDWLVNLLTLSHLSMILVHHLHTVCRFQPSAEAAGWQNTPHVSHSMLWEEILLQPRETVNRKQLFLYKISREYYQFRSIFDAWKS